MENIKTEAEAKPYLSDLRSSPMQQKHTRLTSNSPNAWLTKALGAMPINISESFAENGRYVVYAKTRHRRLRRHKQRPKRGP